ncbi:MAG: SoxR reducing system RseC family protein [Lachnospiraceae bacterium]
MTEQGKVIKIEKNEAVVRVQRKSACASCGMCAMKPKDSHIDVRVENALDAKEGDLVQIKLESGSVAKISLLVYILPLALAVAGMLTGIFCRLPDWANLVLLRGCLPSVLLSFFFGQKNREKQKLQPVCCGDTIRRNGAGNKQERNYYGDLIND